MFIEERHKMIADTLASRMRMTMEDLQVLVKASPATVRRDLRIMEEQGRIVRVHGGAVHPNYMEGEPSFDQKSHDAVAAKLAIAGRISEIIEPGASVFVDSGTTCLEVGKRLLPRKDLTIYTNSVPLAARGVTRGGARLICIGGEIREVSRALVGALSLNWLMHLRFDYAILGASGISAKEGATTTELSEASIKQELLQRSPVRILAADSGKWHKPQSIGFARWEDFKYWVTDDLISRDAVEFVANRGVRVEVTGTGNGSTAVESVASPGEIALLKA